MDLDKQQILDLLAELGDEMQSRGQRAEMFIVGGAAMALAFDARRATRDIDAVFVPKAAVLRGRPSSGQPARAGPGLAQ